MEESGTKKHNIFAYEPISNGRAERMVGTIKSSIGRVFVSCLNKWDVVVGAVVFGYRHHPLRDGYSPFELLYGVMPKTFLSDVTTSFRALKLAF